VSSEVDFPSVTYPDPGQRLRCNDLYRVTWLTTKNRLVGLSEAEAAELADANPRDQSAARWFGVVYVVGLSP